MHKNPNRVNITHQVEVILLEDENTNMLEVIFRAREEELASLNNADKNFFKVHNINRCAKRDSLNAELETMPKDFNQLKENIKIKLDNYVETINCENWYLCKKYCLEGLKDGMNLKEEIK